MATFSDYVAKTLPFLGGTVQLKIRALSAKESPEFVRGTKAMQARWKESERLPDERDETYLPRLQAVTIEMDAYVNGILGKTMDTKSGPKGYYVRLIEPLVNEDDDSKITHCVALGERGGTLFRMAVIAELASLADVDPFLGNSSGSPSTSTVAAGLTTSVDPATTIGESGCSPSFSTATAPTAPDESSSQAA